MTATQTTMWGLRVLDEFELPTWFVVPDETNPDEATSWANDLQERLPPAFEQRGPHTVEDDVRDELGYALQAASGSGDLVTFQIWPVAHPISVLCSVYLVEGAFAPAAAEGGRRVVHHTDARHLGPGLQYSVERAMEVGPELVALVEVHFVFTDGNNSLVFTLWPSVAAVSASALPGFALLKDCVGLCQRDGTPFAAVAPTDAPSDGTWLAGGMS